jgi:ComF family protein
MKFLAGEGLADLVGRIFAEVRGESLKAVEVDLVTPVPLHWWRKWTRGYNQSEAVARELASALNVTFLPRLLRRIRWTPQQVQPTREARRENVKGAFRVCKGARLTGKTVLLVDDVMTTGSTLSEAAKVLRNAGADRVIVAVLARRDNAFPGTQGETRKDACAGLAGRDGCGTPLVQVGEAFGKVSR